MAEMSSMGIGSKPCLDIRPSCDQINDRSISFSQLGKGKLMIESAGMINLIIKNHIHSTEIPKLICRFLTRYEIISPSSKLDNFIKFIGIVRWIVDIVSMYETESHE